MITKRRFAQSASIVIVGAVFAGTLRGAYAANGLSEDVPLHSGKPRRSPAVWASRSPMP